MDTWNHIDILVWWQSRRKNHRENKRGNEMTARKKKGIGFGISAVAFALASAVFIGWDVTPDWVNTALNLVAVIAGALGFSTVYPDTEE